MPSSGVQTCALDRKSTRLNSSHGSISYAVFCLQKKKGLPVHPGWRHPTLATRSDCRARRRTPFCTLTASECQRERREPRLVMVVLFFFNDTATTEIYTLSLHDALPILALLALLTLALDAPAQPRTP